MTKLSVNINKIATLRNARGGNVPDLLKVASDIQKFGGQGITIHPRPDERHIRYQDARDLKSIVYTEYNIEGNPEKKFIDLVLEIKPTQVTLVPDAVDAITSNAGWDTVKNEAYLTEIVQEFQRNGIRTSIFVDPVLEMIEGAKATGSVAHYVYQAKGFMGSYVPMFFFPVSSSTGYIPIYPQGAAGGGAGTNGTAATYGQTGGGGGGSTGGSGNFGTSWSGGSGGGAGPSAVAGALYGGLGGNAATTNFGGGAGNPGGTSGGGTGVSGGTGTGGFIMLVVKGSLTIGSTGIISANGVAGGTGTAGGGGGSGGGRVIILYTRSLTNNGSITVNGGAGGGTAPSTGSAGGSGTITLREVSVF